MSDPASSPGEGIGTRWPELAVSGALMLVSGLIITDSLRVGAGWAEDGPRAGYFPFFIGLLLLLASGWTFVGQLMRWRAKDPIFAERSQIGLVFAVLVPTAIYALLIHPLGLYAASLLMIAYFMRRYGKYGWLPVAGVSVGVPLVFFLVFERWFLVPLPKGPLERLFGL